MAYKRPLSKGQSLFFGIIWLVLLYLLISYSDLKPLPLLFVIVVSGFFVWYPIYKSYKQNQR